MQHDIKTEATTTMRLPRDLWTATRHLALQRRMSAVALVIEGLRMVLEKYGQSDRRSAA